MDLGPIVDTSTPYSAIGFSAHCALKPSIMPTWTEELDPLSAQSFACPFWHYSSREHSSAACRMFSSVSLTATTRSSTRLIIRCLVIDGSSE